MCRVTLKKGREEYVLQHILYHLEGHTNVRGDALHEGPLLIKGLMHALICGMWVLTCHPGQGGHQIPPAFHFLTQTAVMRLLGPHEPPKVADYHQNMKSVALEEGLFLWDVQGRHYQYALGGIQELASRGPSHHKIIQVLLDPLEGAARPRVIRVSGLGDSDVGLPQFTDEQEDSQPIHHHRQWVSLGHSLLAKKK